MQRLVRTVVACAVAIFSLPACALDRTQLAVIINTWDPLSVQIGQYYAEQRRIPYDNIVKVGFPTGRTALGVEEFTAIKKWADGQVRPRVQAYVLTWMLPYRAGCMSITSAFAFGFNPSFCAEGCKPTLPSPYYNSRARLPFAQLGMRPTMVLAATDLEQAKALIDRGVKADGTHPTGTAYLLSTSDSARNVRSVAYPLVQRILKNRFRVRVLNEDALRNENDVMFYFLGSRRVEGLETLHFLPGAIADHLTSFGGALADDSQMSALRWLEAGATGSYGTVEEPCNFPQKFPDPVVVTNHYLRGETLIEAYWKSVLMPGQGIFIGEPLAAPFREGARRTEHGQAQRTN